MAHTITVLLNNISNSSPQVSAAIEQQVSDSLGLPQTSSLGVQCRPYA